MLIVRRIAAFVLVTGSSFAWAAEPNLGFEVDGSTGVLRIAQVYDLTDAKTAGLKPGDVVVNVAGGNVSTEKDFAAIVATREPGAVVQLRYKPSRPREVVDGLSDLLKKNKRTSEPVTVRLAVVDKRAMLEAIAEKKKQDDLAAQQKRQQEDAFLRQKEERIATKGALSITAGQVRDNAIGMPEIKIRITNIADQPIEAVEFRVAMFDKFGRPAMGLWGETNDKIFLHQEVIEAGSSVFVVANVPWHSTVGKAEITVVKYALANQRVITPPSPDTVVVAK